MSAQAFREGDACGPSAGGTAAAEREDVASSHGHAHAHGVVEEGEEAAVQAGLYGSGEAHGHSHGRGEHGAETAAQRALGALLKALGLARLAARLRASVLALAVSWGCLLLTGLCTAFARLTLLPPPLAAAVGAGATALVYLLAGLPEFLDVAHDLAGARVNIHVLTTLAVFGTVALGCATEGALLLVLFATAKAVEAKLTQHAAGDLRALWAAVPKTALVVTRRLDGAADLTTAQATPCAAVPLGALVLVAAGQQVPLDGVVAEGCAAVSLEHITG